MITVAVSVLIYTIFFTVVSFLRFDAFSYSDFDFAIFTHECWKILHGSTLISIFSNTSIFGNALELISFVISPVFSLFSYNPKGLLFLQSLFLGLGAVPIFLIARSKLPQRFAVCFAVSYLLYPPLWYANLYEYNPLIYSTFTLLMAFYFFEKQHFKMFMLFAVLTMINRVDLGLVTFMFGIYALFSKRSLKWIIVPSLVSLCWVAVGLLIIIPKFKNVLGYDAFYPQFGHGFGNIIRNIIFHPELLWNSLVTADNRRYLFEILYPVGFMSLFGLKEFFICVLSLVQHLISVRPQEHTIHFHYTAMITPFVYISAIYGISRLAKSKPLSNMVCVVPVFLSLMGNILYGPLSHSKVYWQQVCQTDISDYKKVMLYKIPPTAPVISSFEFSPMLAGRYDYYSFHYVASGDFREGVPYQIPHNIEYAMINFQDARMQSFYNDHSDLLMKRFFERGHFNVVDMADNVVLFKKDYASRLKLYELKPKPIENQGGVFSTPNGLKLLAVDVKKNLQGEARFLDLAFHWQVQHKISDTIGMLLLIDDQEHKEVYRGVRLLGYGVFPTRRWSSENEILDYYRLLLPKNLKKGEYKIHLVLFSKDNNSRYPLLKIDGNNFEPTVQSSIIITNFQSF